jgi:hypothetical protein
MLGTKTAVKNIELPLDLLFLQEGDYIIAYCPALELSAYGKNEKSAMMAFEDVVSIFIDETTEKGTLEKVLLHLGWRLQLKPVLEFLPPQMKKAEMMSRFPSIIQSRKYKIQLSPG